MSRFSAHIERREKKLYINFEGTIDKESVLPVLDTKGITEINIDLDGIKSINSLGIHAWILWIEPMPESIPIVFRNVRQNLIMQFGMVRGFLPRHARVDSFYIPMFCERCDYGFSILAEKTPGHKIDLDKGAMSQLKGRVCKKKLDEFCEADPELMLSKFAPYC